LQAGCRRETKPPYVARQIRRKVKGAMVRRNFLKTIPATAMLPELKAAPRLKITGVRLRALKVLRETGSMEAAWNPGTVTRHRIGGGSYLEIQSDQGLTGIGPAMDDRALENARAQLVGQDPFDIEQLAGPLRYYVAGEPSPVSRSRYGTLQARRRNSRFTNCGARRKTGFRLTRA